MGTRPTFSPKKRIPAQLFPQIVNFARAIPTPDAANGRTVTLPFESPILYAAVNVSIQPDKAAQKLTFDRIAEVIQHLVYTRKPMALINGDFCLYGTRVLIVESMKTSAELGFVYQIGCVEYITVPVVIPGVNQ